jgi:outer membrane biosynthesis protein TonB
VSRAIPWLLPVAAFLAALIITASGGDERAPAQAPARAAMLRAPATEARPAPPVLVAVRDIPAPLATPEPTPAPRPARALRRAPAPTPTPFATPTPSPEAAAPPPPPPPAPAPVAPEPTPKPTPAPTFDDSGTGPPLDDTSVSP